MARRILICVLMVMLSLQGITQVRAAVQSDLAMQEHCAGHDMSLEDCDCCPDELAMGSGCSSLCSSSAALPSVSLTLPSPASPEQHSLIVLETQSPAYLPLNPPPIV
jgi:hypothetical protein